MSFAIVSPTSTLDLRTVLPSGVVRAVSVDLENCRGEDKIIVLKPAAARMMAMSASSSCSEVVRTVFVERVNEASGLTERPFAGGTGGNGMNVAWRMCIELPSRVKVGDESTVAGEMTRRAAMPIRLTAAVCMRRNEDRSGILAAAEGHLFGVEVVVECQGLVVLRFGS